MKMILRKENLSSLMEKKHFLVSYLVSFIFIDNFLDKSWS